MKLLLVTTSYPSADEGSAAAGLFVRDFAEALMHQGAEVEVVAPATENHRDQGGKLRITRFAVPRLPLSLLSPVRPGDWPAIVQTLAVGRHAVMQSCAQNRPDHVFALWALPSGAWARRAAQRFSIPYSIWALGSDIWGLGQVPVIHNRLAGVLRDARHCFADGIGLAAEVQKISGRECRFLPSSREFGPPGQRHPSSVPPYRLAFLGRWHPNKGSDLLLDALALFTESEWARTEAVRLCGGGPLESAMRKKAEALADTGYPVILGGYLDRAAARELFEWADYVVIPSRIESIPVVFSDAMQMHRPVIATPVGDLPDLIARFGCGIVADEVSAPGLAGALRQALTVCPARFQNELAAAAEAMQIQTAAAGFLSAIRT